jgi:ADP-ribose pyrophosphatase YjhB (NUDIX family)
MLGDANEGRKMNAGRARGETEATLVDGAFQVAYQCAYGLMKAYWRLRHPTTHGTLVTLWHAGEVLLVRNSYVRYYSAPGGYVRRGERARTAALRELREEIGLTARDEDLVPLLEETHEWEGKRDHVQIYALDLESRPHVQIDHREVIDASWYVPEAALGLDLFPPLRRAIQKRCAA